MKSTSRHLVAKPQSYLGSWSVWLELAFVLMFVANVLVNVYVIRPNVGPLYMAFVLFMLACGLAGGVLGSIAVVKRQEHSALVWIAILIGLFTLLIFLNEVMQGIQYMLGG